MRRDLILFFLSEGRLIKGHESLIGLPDLSMRLLERSNGEIAQMILLRRGRHTHASPLCDSGYAREGPLFSAKSRHNAIGGTLAPASRCREHFRQYQKMQGKEAFSMPQAGLRELCV